MASSSMTTFCRTNVVHRSINTSEPMYALRAVETKELRQGRAPCGRRSSTAGAACIRWTEAAGGGPARVYVHGLGSASTVYHAHIAARPELAGRRTLVRRPARPRHQRPARRLRLHPGGPRGTRSGGRPGRGRCRRGRDSSRTAWAAPSRSCSPIAAPSSSHGSSSRRPTSIRIPRSPRAAAASPPTRRTTIVDNGGHARVLEKIGPLWAATMRLADPRALHRSATGLAQGTHPDDASDARWG